MVIGAAKSHMKSEQHNQIMKHKRSSFTQSITDFFGGTNKSAPTTNKSGKQVLFSMAIPEQTSDVSTVLVSSPSISLIISEKVLHTEVLWVIEVKPVTTHLVPAKILAVYFLKCFQKVRLHSHFHVELQSVLV